MTDAEATWGIARRVHDYYRRTTATEPPPPASDEVDPSAYIDAEVAAQAARLDEGGFYGSYDQWFFLGMRILEASGDPEHDNLLSNYQSQVERARNAYLAWFRSYLVSWQTPFEAQPETMSAWSGHRLTAEMMAAQYLAWLPRVRDRVLAQSRVHYLDQPDEYQEILDPYVYHGEELLRLKEKPPEDLTDDDKRLIQESHEDAGEKIADTIRKREAYIATSGVYIPRAERPFADQYYRPRPYL